MYSCTAVVPVRPRPCLLTLHCMITGACIEGVNTDRHTLPSQNFRYCMIIQLVAVVANKSAGQSRRLQSVLVQIGCMIQEDANTPHYNSDDVQTSASQSTCSHGPGRCAAAACSSRWAKHSAEAIVTVLTECPDIAPTPAAGAGISSNTHPQAMGTATRCQKHRRRCRRSFVAYFGSG